jgi:hypothetical protein
VGVGPARADVLGELAVAHREHPEEEASIEGVRLARQLLLDVREAPVDLAQGVGISHVAPQVLERVAQRPPRLVRVVALEFVGEAVEAREGRGEDDARLVAQRLGQQPALGQELAGGRLAPALEERDPRLSQRVETGRNGQLGRDVQRLDQLLGHAVLGAEIEGAGAAGELDDVGGVLDCLEPPAAVLALDDPRDVLARHLHAEALGHEVDELLTPQDTLRVGRVHHGLLGAGQAEARARDDDGAARHLVAIQAGPPLGRETLQRPRDGLREGVHG